MTAEMWGFGRGLLTTQANASTLRAAIVWTILGAAGVLGAFGGDAVRRVGLGAAWIILMLALGLATALFALAPGTYAVVFTAAALFGAAYIGLTGVVLLWSTRLYPTRPSFGVGIFFAAIATGQAVGSPLVGQLIGSLSVARVFYVWAGLAVLGAIAGPASATERKASTDESAHRLRAPFTDRYPGAVMQAFHGRVPPTGRQR